MQKAGGQKNTNTRGSDKDCFSVYGQGEEEEEEGESGGANAKGSKREKSVGLSPYVFSRPLDGGFYVSPSSRFAKPYTAS